jgi:hypothetical protein
MLKDQDYRYTVDSDICSPSSMIRDMFCPLSGIPGLIAVPIILPNPVPSN